MKQVRLPVWVKNGPDALEMGCLYYPRKQTSVSYGADADVIVCYGAAKLADKHLASKIHCVDDGIVLFDMVGCCSAAFTPKGCVLLVLNRCQI